jgi:CDP-paratose 2-epimerase
MEAVTLAEKITGTGTVTSYRDASRVGDHIWWISNLERFQSHDPDRRPSYDAPTILTELYEANADRWKSAP